MPSSLCRSRNGLTNFEIGPSLFDDVEIRHAGLLLEDSHLVVWFTRAGDAPEGILQTTVDLRSDWLRWKPTDPVEILRPIEPWEGADLEVKPTQRGPSFEPQNGLRDPFALDLSEDGRAPDRAGRWLFYAAAGEFSLGVTRLGNSSVAENA